MIEHRCRTCDTEQGARLDAAARTTATAALEGRPVPPEEAAQLARLIDAAATWTASRRHIEEAP